MRQGELQHRSKRVKACVVGMLLSVALFCDSAQAADRLAEDASFCRKRVKVNAAGFGARLRVSRAIYAPGAQAVFRIDNMGSVAISLIGESFVLERFQNGVWLQDASSPKTFTRIRLGALGPGRSGFCRAFEIPVEQPEGTYRFRKSVGVEGKHDRRSLSAVFKVGAD
jgi:hypothetical protein